MKISVDNQVVRLFSEDADKILNNPLVGEGDLNFSWPSLLEYLELGEIFHSFPPFEKDQALFTATIAALCEVNNAEDLFYIFDSLFAEMLKQVKALPEIDPLFLLGKIAEKKNRLSFFEMKAVLTPALALQEKKLRENTPHAMHDLVLYLAWDRICVAMARLFDYQCTDTRYQQNIGRLKWCLIESFQHIFGQKKTSPSFYRLIEALFYYQMREERLQIHQEDEWELLAQSFPALIDSRKLIDCFYIDHAIAKESEAGSEEVYHLTLDSPEMVECRFALAHYMIGRLKEEIPNWNFSLRPGQIVFVT